MITTSRTCHYKINDGRPQSDATEQDRSSTGISHHCRLKQDGVSVASDAQDQQCAARDRGQLQLEGSPVSTAPHLLKLAATSPAIKV